MIGTCFNRPQYLKVCFSCLQKADLQNVVLCIVDDGSDPPAANLIRQVKFPNAFTVLKIRASHNRGIAHSLRTGFEALLKWKDAENSSLTYFSNLDSDMIVKPNFLNICKQLWDQIEIGDVTEVKHNPPNDMHSWTVISGFNAKQHKVAQKFDNYVTKRQLGGCHLFFHQSTLKSLVLPSIHPRHNVPRRPQSNRWDSIICKKLQMQYQLCYVTTPSVCQHIGKVGVNSRGQCDTAADWRK